MNQYDLTLTNDAKARVEFLLQDEPQGSKMRIAVNGGGCSGFQYEFSFSQELNQDDILLENMVVVDEVSASIIKGSVIDYVETLTSANFEIRNPLASAKCGCGNSFSI